MPYYDYRCSDCSQSNRLFYSFQDYATAEPTCSHCGSSRMQRRIGRIAVAKSDGTRIDSMLDSNMMSAIDQDDPQALGQFMRQMSDESGEPLGDEFGEVVERLEKGQSPDQIEQAMPDLGTDAT